MARRTIEVNPFSSKSINSAIMSLQREKKRLTDDFKASFLKHLGAELHGQLQWEYDDAILNPINDEIEVDDPYIDGDGRVVIRAYGESIAFVEFGAGIYADDGEFIALQFYPGSWSEQHGRTYQAWVDAGMPGEYKWNQLPVHAFDSIIRDLDRHVRNAAYNAYKEVYG